MTDDHTTQKFGLSWTMLPCPIPIAVLKDIMELGWNPAVVVPVMRDPTTQEMLTGSTPPNAKVVGTFLLLWRDDGNPGQL